MQRALAAAVAEARAQSLATSGAEVIADRSNLVLRLSPALVARVAMATSLARVGMAWLAREVEVSRFLAMRGAGVTRPIAGPFERDGYVISFWEAETVDGVPDPGAAGRGLRACHEALVDYPGALPLWGGFEEAKAVLERARGNGMMTPAELATMDAAFDRSARIVEGARARSASFQPVHGDAHIGNVIATARGVLWTDWEDAFLGPIELDLAALRSRADLFGEDRAAIDAMTAAYGTEANFELVADLGLVRNVQVIPWLAVFAERDPSLLDRMRLRLSKLG